MSSGRRSRLAIGAGVLGLFCALTWWLLDCRLASLSDHLPSDLGDPVLNLYLLEWGGRCLERGLHGLLGFWNANFFFPAKGVVTFSDSLIGPAAASSLLRALGVTDVGSYDVLFLGSFVLSGLATSWVLRRAGTSVAAAVLGGIVFAYSPYRFDQRAHLQVLLMQWIPLLLWLWHRLLERPTAGRAVAFVVVYVLHMSGGMYLAYLVHFALAILLLEHRDRFGSLLGRRSLRVLVPAAVGCTAVAAAVFVPYVITSHRYGFERSIAEFAHYGATIGSYLAVGPGNSLWGGLLGRLSRPENQLFAGLIPTVLAVVGIRGLWSQQAPRLERLPAQPAVAPGGGLPPAVGRLRQATLIALLSLAAAGFVLGDLRTLTMAGEIERALIPARLSGYGPASLLAVGCGAAWLLCRWRWRGTWPLRPGSATAWDRGLLMIGVFCALLSLPVVFVPLSSVVPGLDGMRVPTRCYPLLSFALAYFAARGLDRALRGISGRRRQVAVVAVAALVVLELRDDMDWLEWPNRGQIPPIFHRMAEVADIGAVLHLPIPAPAFESHYMYYSTLDWRPIVNGYSGYLPPTYLEVERRIDQELYRESTLDYLSELGVTHIAVHPFLFKMPRERRRLTRWEHRFAEGPRPRLELVLIEGRDRLWRLLPAGGGGRPVATRESAAERDAGR